MYITNPESIPKEKIYFCNGLIGNWLIQNGIPLFTRQGKMLGFAKTPMLETALKKLPFWFKISKIF